MLNQDSLALVFDELDVKDLMEVNNYFVLLLQRLVRQWNYIYYIYIYIYLYYIIYLFFNKQLLDTLV